MAEQLTLTAPGAAGSARPDGEEARARSDRSSRPRIFEVVPCEVTIFGIELVRATAAEAWLRRVMAGHPRAVIAFGVALSALTGMLALAPSSPTLTKLLVAWDVGASVLAALTVERLAARFVHGWGEEAVARRDGERAVACLVVAGSALSLICAVSGRRGGSHHEAVIACSLEMWTVAASSLLALATLAMREAVAGARRAFAGRTPAAYRHAECLGFPRSGVVASASGRTAVPVGDLSDRPVVSPARTAIKT